MKLSEKLVLHIPEAAWCDDHLEDIPVDIEMAALTNALSAIGATSFYLQKVTGSYKGRMYPERLLVLFCRDGPEAEMVIAIFGDWFRSRNEVMRQEAFSYERNGTLFIMQLA